MPEESQNGWKEWSKVVLHELEQLNDGFDKLTNEFQDFKVEVAKEIASKKEVDVVRREMEQFKRDYAKENSELSVQVAKLETELKVKAGVFGALGSLLGVIIAIAIAVFF